MRIMHILSVISLCIAGYAQAYRFEFHNNTPFYIQPTVWVARVFPPYSHSTDIIPPNGKIVGEQAIETGAACPKNITFSFHINAQTQKGAAKKVGGKQKIGPIEMPKQTVKVPKEQLQLVPIDKLEFSGPGSIDTNENVYVYNFGAGRQGFNCRNAAVMFEMTTDGTIQVTPWKQQSEGGGKAAV